MSLGAWFWTAALLLPVSLAGEIWPRHTIDNTSAGADGVRLADVNDDGFPDIATGWEEGGIVRIYLNPGPLQTSNPWPAVTVGEVQSPEDAVFVDLDGDGTTDVVSSCEGRQKSVFVHWGPRRAEDFEVSDRWRTGAIEASRDQRQWMYALPMEVDFRRGVDLIAGSKGFDGQIGWFESPADPRELGEWRWRPIRNSGWVMSLVARDMDLDGDGDILASDRRGEAPGVFWLENPGPGPRQLERWEEHPIGAAGLEVMFLDEADIDGDGRMDVVSAVRPRSLFLHSRLDRKGLQWESRELLLPRGAGTSKGVAAGDIDLDGTLDLVFSCEHARDGLSGIMWISDIRSADKEAPAFDISGPEGVKFDQVKLVDLDNDGDLDVLTCEEITGLGVIWYENPAR